MARIGIVSDTHGKKILDLVSTLKAQDLDSLIFLGDLHQDGLYLHRLTGLPTIQVLGNNDPAFQGQVNNELIKLVDGYKIFMCHGHLYGVKYGLDRLSYRAEELGAHICLYGHTHVYNHDVINGIHYFNPGSASISRTRLKEKSFGILDTSQGINFEKILIP